MLLQPPFTYHSAGASGGEYAATQEVLALRAHVQTLETQLVETERKLREAGLHATRLRESRRVGSAHKRAKSGLLSVAALPAAAPTPPLLSCTQVAVSSRH